VSDVGHNSNAQLKSICERINNLEDERKSLADDIREIYAEAKSNGYDVPALRAVIKRQRADAQKLAEHEAIVEALMASLGMV
jgi:uncharacterized protein (UPF0335 family)